MDQTSKICTKCEQEKLISEFSCDRKTKDGFRYNCKSCNKSYYENNKEKINIYNNKYSRNLNREKKKSYNKKYYNLEYHRQYRAKNKQKIAEYMKKYNKNKKQL